jgi:two-component system, chemotaxis family, protein-glutamate methylesterase/glutaminase
MDTPVRTVVIGASAGGVTPLCTVMAGLPAGLPAAVGVVLHVPATGGHALPNILGRAGALPAAAAADGESVRTGRIYVAPPDHHMLIRHDRIRLSRGPRQNGFRPAVDPLFTSAALAGGSRTLAVVLSGSLDDGAAGCAAVEKLGGTVVVQDPLDSEYSGMPTAALAATRQAVTLPLRDIGGYIKEHSAAALANGQTPADPELEREVNMLLGHNTQPPGKLTGLSCPQCGGPLNHDAESTPPRYECRVGHAWSPQSLLDAHSGAVETALWIAIMRLDERSRFMQRLAESSAASGRSSSATHFTDAAREALDAAKVLRVLLERAGTPQDS